MKNYVRYILKLDQPLKMGAQGNQNNTEALTYIAGSTIRGAFIRAAIQKYYNGSSESLDDSAVSFLFKDSEFSDAYLCMNQQHLIPVPAVYYADKHSVRTAQKNGTELAVQCRETDPPAEGEIRMDVGKYCSFDKSGINVAAVRMVGNLHIAVKGENRSSQLFRYEAIEEDQCFSGTVKCRTEEDAERYLRIIENAEFYLGGSKGSGYGRVHTEHAELVSYDDIRRSYHLAKNEESGILTVYFLSNSIILDENGAVSGMIPPALIEEKLGIQNVAMMQSYCSVMRTAGYNHTWKADNVQQTAVRAGSYIRYSYSGTIDPEKLKAFEVQGVGVRRQEGFGRILLDVKFGDCHRTELKPQAETESSSVLTDEDKAQMKRIREEINRERINNRIQIFAVDCGDNYHNGKVKIKMAQISRLFQTVASIRSSCTNDADGITALRNFMDSLKKTNDVGHSTYKGAVDSYTRFKFRIGPSNYYTLESLVELCIDNRKSYSDLDPDFTDKCPLWGSQRPASCTEFGMKLQFLEEFLYCVMREEGLQR